MTRFLTMLSVMILGIWALAFFSDMPPTGIKSVHGLMLVVGIFALLNGWTRQGGSSGDFFFIAAIFVGFLWGSSSLIGKPIWVPFVVFGGILLTTWALRFIWGYFFYRHPSDAEWIGVDIPDHGTVMVSRAGKTEHEIIMETKRPAKFS